MPHTPFCIDLVAPALNLPPPQSMKALVNGTPQQIMIPAGGVLSLLANAASVVNLNFEGGAVVALPVPPGPLHVTLPQTALRSVTLTTATAVSAWDGASQLQTNDSFTKE